jgi:hypothetical protein
MEAVIFSLKQEMVGIDHNINHYTKLDSTIINDKDRHKTISDLKELKQQYLDAIEILKG